VTNVNIGLTQAQAQNAMIRITGALTGSIAIGPNSGVLMTGFYYFENLTSGAFSITFGNSGGTVALPQGRRGVMWVDTTNGPRVVSLVGSVSADVIATGTRMVFYNSTVPAGWAALGLGSDYLVRLVDSPNGGISGGSLPFSTVFGQTTTGSTALTVDQMPSHSHANTGRLAGTFNLSFQSGGVNTTPSGGTPWLTDAAGGGSGHVHPMDMRVFYLNMVIGQRS
jgi:hypothetical protein